MDAIKLLIDQHRKLEAQMKAAVDARQPKARTASLAQVGDHLTKHITSEEEVFYPAVARVLGTPQATVTMSRDHAEVSRLTDEFRSLRTQTSESSEQNANDLRRVLYGLYAVLKLHLAKEEEIFTPLLDQHLNDEEAHRLFHKMAEATHGNALH